MNMHSPTMTARAALYLRVSTARQAEHDISIPDQKRQGEAYCEQRGYQLVETYVEPGATATNDKRPEFQRMIEAGTSKPAPFDIVVVHSFSRFFRDHFEMEFYVRKLAKNGVKLVSITQERIALDILLDPEIGIVSLGGRAGTGKSALALCAGLEAVLERRQHRKVVVFRPLYAVGGQDLGYLPGTENEKMSPWAQAVFDTLGAVTTSEVVEEVLDRGMLEVLPLTHIRGRSLHDAFVIVDEAQSLERNVLLTVLSRIGRDSRVVLTHDVAQRDNLRVGRHDGVVAVVEKLKGHPLFAHVTLTRSERSPIAALVTEMLEELPV